MAKPTKLGPIPTNLLQSTEWLAALVLLTRTSLKEFYTPDYINFTTQEIDFAGIINHAATHSQQFLARLAAHLFNAYGFDLPPTGMFNLDQTNLEYALLAIMLRHRVTPAALSARLMGLHLGEEE